MISRKSHAGVQTTSEYGLYVFLVDAKVVSEVSSFRSCSMAVRGSESQRRKEAKTGISDW